MPGQQVLVSQQLPTSETVVFQGTPVTITGGSLCNTTAAAITVYLSVVIRGGTVGDGTHRIISGYSLAANDTLPLASYLGGMTLGTGDKISAYAGAAGVDLVLTGLLV